MGHLKKLNRKKNYIVLPLIVILLVGMLSGCTSNSTKGDSLTRIDEEGYLYYMDYTKDYYASDVMDKMKQIGFVSPGCSVFYTHNTDGDGMIGRNYDYAHSVSKEDQTLTGLNIVLHCKPQGKYESIAVADAVWCGEDNPLLQKGGPDKEGFDVKLLDILPYQCMDGVNEKGLYVSIQRVDIKEGEQKCRFPAGSSMLLRHILDDCGNVDEAISKVYNGILLPEDWQNCHFMVCDASGHSVVIESRNSVISVIPADICTNFYLGSGDFGDSYNSKGKLREEAVKMVDENGVSSNTYGYGHGYHRYVTLKSQMERYRDTSREDYYTVMPEENVLVMLQSVVQNSYTNAAGLSWTQYSAIYNSNKKTLKIWSFQNYKKEYTFDISGKQIKSR